MKLAQESRQNLVEENSNEIRQDVVESEYFGPEAAPPKLDLKDDAEDLSQDKENQEESEKEWQALSKLIDKPETPMRVRRLSKKRSSLTKQTEDDVDEDDEDEDEDEIAMRAQLLAAMAMKKKDSPFPSKAGTSIEGSSVAERKINRAAQKEDNQNAAPALTPLLLPPKALIE